MSSLPCITSLSLFSVLAHYFQNVFDSRDTQLRPQTSSHNGLHVEETERCRWQRHPSHHN